MYQDIINLINTYITANGVGAITGSKLNQILNALANYYGFDGVTVATLPAGSDATATVTNRTLNLGIPSGRDGDDGENAVNPFKGWWMDFDDLKAAYTATEGDSAYVKNGAVWDIYVYDSTASSDNYWVDSGMDADTSNVQTFQTGEHVNQTPIDYTHLSNPLTGSLALAEDAMLLRSKLQGATLTETKVQLVTSGSGQNVFKGYIQTKSENHQNLMPKVSSTSGSYRYIVVDVEGVDKVRFIGQFAKSATVDGGYAFYDSSNYSGGSFLQDNTGWVYYKTYDYDTTLAESTTKEYIVQVPPNAKYLKVACNFGAVTPSNFYLYKQIGTDAVQASGSVITKKTELIRGSIETSNGNMLGGLTSETYYFRSYLLTTRLRVFETDKILSVDGVPAGGSVEIYCFDEGFMGIGKVKQFPSSLPIGTRYIRPRVLFENNQNFDLLEITVTANTRGKLEEVKDGPRSEQTPGETTRFFTFEVKQPKTSEDSDATVQYLPNEDKSFGNGYIQFAKNYTPDGEPTPVAIFFHGTEGYYFNEYSIRLYQAQIQFLAKCGYNVIDCNSHSFAQYQENQAIATTKDGNWCLPMAYECYSKAWDFVKRTYNVDDTRVYAFAKSAGGLLATAFASAKSDVFKFKAVGLLAPSLDVVVGMLEMGPSANNEFLAAIGCPSPNVSGGLSGGNYDGRPATEPDKTYIMTYADLIARNDAWFNLTLGLDATSFIEQVLDTGNNSDNLLANTTLASLVAAAKRLLSCPCKIWHAIDDENVPIATSMWLQQMVRNAGGECYLRKFPANCGKHHAVDSSTDPAVEATIPKTSYLTPFAETITISTAYAELVDWFDRW